MKLFGRAELSAVETAITVRDNAVMKRDRLATQLTQTQAELAKVKDAAAAAALRESALEVSEISGAVAHCAATCEALSSALASADAELHQAEVHLGHQQDRELRGQSVRTIEEIIQAINAAVPTISTGVDDLIAALRRASPFSLDSRQTLGVFETLKSDLSTLVDTATAALSHYAVSIENGSMPARLPAPEAQPVAIAAPAPTTSMTALFDVRWTDASGAVRLVAKGWDAPLPITTAQRALVAGIVVPADSPEGIRARRERASVHADIDRAVDLDQANPTPPEPPPERWMRPFAEPKWQLPSGSPPRPWIGKGQPS